MMVTTFSFVGRLKWVRLQTLVELATLGFRMIMTSFEHSLVHVGVVCHSVRWLRLDSQVTDALYIRMPQADPMFTTNRRGVSLSCRTATRTLLSVTQDM